MATVTYSTRVHAPTAVLSDAYTIDAQGAPSITQLTDGTLVTTFNHFGKTQLAMTAYAKGVDPSTTSPLFEVAPVNTTFTADQFDSQTTGLALGGFVTVFNDTSSGANHLRYRVFDKNGVASKNDALVFDSFLNTRMGGVAPLKDGGFVVVFEADFGGGETAADYAIFKADGTLVGGFAADDVAPNNILAPAVATTEAGFVLAWSEKAGNGDTEIHVQRHGSNNQILPPDVLTDTTGSINDQVQAIGLKDGGYAIAYRDNGWGGTEVSLQIFNADGSARSAIKRANNVTDGLQEKPSLTLLDNGYIAVTWQTASAASPGNTDIACRVFDTKGNVMGSQFVVANGAKAESAADAVGIAGGVLAHVYQTADTTFDGSKSGVAIAETLFVRKTVGGSKEDTIIGDALVDEIEGLGGVDTILGGGGDDIIAGGAGADKLDGGSGRDLLDYGASADGVNITLVTGFGQGGDAEGDMIVVGTFEDVRGSDIGDDIIYGTSKANRLYGGGGDDQLIGNGAIDQLFGGEGDDLLAVSMNTGGTYDGGTGIDAISFESINVGIILFLDGSSNGGGATGFSLAPNTIEDAYGTSEDDKINGTNNVDNTLWGGEGKDVLIGLSGNDTLEGGLEADTLVGGQGADTYIVNEQADIVVEEASEGSGDMIKARANYVLGANVHIELMSTIDETKTTAINLTGNAIAQQIVGNAGANILHSGGGAADSMKGLAGNDTYRVFNAADTIEEGVSQGTADKVMATVSYSLGTGVEIETMQTNSSAGTSAINFTGNEFAQEIIGNAGDNTLHDGGKGGSDLLRGLGGNDTYRVFNSGAVIQEGNAQGTADKVMAAVDYALGSGVRIEILNTNGGAGTSAIDLTGNEFAQEINGNAGSNILDSKGGIDLLKGLGGKDFFVFTTSLGPDNVDAIADFKVADDTIQLDDAIFAAFAGKSGAILAGNFRANTTGKAQDSDDRIIYDSDDGKLFYDADGNGAVAGVEFASVDTSLALTNEDFVIV